MAKTPPTGLRLDPHIKAALVKAAEDEQRTLSNLIAKVLTDWLRDSGRLAEPKKGKTK